MTESAVAEPAAIWPGARLVAGLFGLGHFPLAPGTVASAFGLLTGALLMRLGSAALPEALLAVTIIGLLAVDHSGEATADPGWIVIDELAGQWLAMVMIPRISAIGLIAAFVLFRALDIAKPGPVGWADRRHNAAGIMGDDLVAGAMVACAIWLAVRIWPHVLG
jgi:phosphatidylglycerophosphatase A